MNRDPRYERRAFFGLVAAGATGYAWWSAQESSTAQAAPSRVSVVDFDGHGMRLGRTDVLVVRQPEALWKKQLSSESFEVTRHADTEFAGSGEYDRFYEDGLYRCICCGLALFSSSDKFASGTGWPSFTQPIASENVSERAASWFGIAQREVRCVRCEAHLGHVFEDGPPPLNRRYCINSVALKFAPVSSV